jgi:phage-related tail fiber protein
MPQSIITNLGESLLAAAAGSTSAVEITHVAFGDGNGAAYAPAFSQVALKKERLRVQIESQQLLEGNGWRIKAVVPADTAPFDVCEIGFFTAAGELIALWAGVDVTSRRVGIVTYEINHFLDFSGVADGLLIINAPDDELFNHAVLNLAADATGAINLLHERRTRKEQLLQRDAEMSLGAPVGMISAFGQKAAPDGWLPCDGRDVSRSAYADLFAALGTLWGAGDGVATFTLPDFSGDFRFVPTAVVGRQRSVAINYCIRT